MELKSSTAILLLDFAIGSPSLFMDTQGLPDAAKLGWLAVLAAGAVLATIMHFRGD
ncbi:hypothetical protein [Paraburkholderia sp. SIMBA_054]|uniref:hypothetical protein n=1 Tax=Paraburkholderia sp. SIMBA_054 TaxID=3085795 RepID=UPI00397C8204